MPRSLPIILWNLRPMVQFYHGLGKVRGGGNVSIEENELAKADKGEWYTEGKTLFLTDPVTKQKGTVLFYAEQNRMMLHDGGSEKKIFERIR